MKNHFFKRACVLAISLSLAGLGAPAVSLADIIDTPTMVAAVQRDADLATVRAGLTQTEVRERFVALGVDPARVDARLDALGDAELARLAQQMDAMPAGGDLLVVLGVVFVVLIVLEVTGAIDIFKK
jgi:hypothetical protein